MGMMTSIITQVLQEVNRARRLLLVMHAAPDGDSAGSALSLGMALRRLGKEVSWVAWDGIPARLNFLPGSDQVCDWSAIEVDQFDCVIALDCGSDSRLGAPDLFWARVSSLINIDHHPTNPHFGTINWVDAGVSSTGELVTRLFREAGWSVTVDEALCLYTSISTDTLSFRQVNATVDTLDAVFWLIKNSGLELAHANRLIWDSRPMGELKLLGWALSAVEFSADGKWAWVSVPRPVMNQFAVDDSGVDTIVHHLIAVEGVQVAFLIKETDEIGKVKVSWRSKPPWNSGVLAAQFGGGGHSYAAAAQLEASLSEALVAVKAALADTLHD